MERLREDYNHHRHNRTNHSDHQEQHPNYYQHQHQHQHLHQPQHQNPNQHQFIQQQQHPCINSQDPFAEQNHDCQFNNHDYQVNNHDYQFNNHDHHSNYGTNPQLKCGEPNEPFGGGGGGFCFNDRKRGRYPSGRVGSPDHNGDAVNAKLYVAPILRTTTEEEIRSLFEQHGSVVEVIIPRDKRTGQQQGYCFVKYATIEEADRAIRALNGQYTVPGEVAPIKVRYADGERERLGKVERDHLGKGERELPGGGESVDKLYVGCINKQASKQEIEEV